MVRYLKRRGMTCKECFAYVFFFSSFGLGSPSYVRDVKVQVRKFVFKNDSRAESFQVWNLAINPVVSVKYLNIWLFKFIFPLISLVIDAEKYNKLIVFCDCGIQLLGPQKHWSCPTEESSQFQQCFKPNQQLLF